MVPFPNPGWYPVVYHPNIPNNVNDVESAVKCKLILYADDSALLVSGKDIKVIQETLGKDHARKSATHHL